MITDEDIQAQNFKNGLRGQIQQLVTAFELPTYKQVINKVLMIEKGLDDAQAIKEKNLKKRNRSNDHPQDQSGESFESKTKILSYAVKGKE